MKKLSFCIFFAILIFFTSQQNSATSTPKPQTTSIPTVNQVLTPVQKSYEVMLRRMEGTKDSVIENMVRKQIIIWTSIGLAFVLYFSVMSLVDMHNAKSSILYAKYGTTRGGNEY